MLYLDYYTYFKSLEQTQKNKQLLIISIIILTMLLIGIIIEIIKHKFLHKIKNKRIKEFISKL